MAVVSMKELLESGVHFGHRTQRWNPRMKRYIFTERNGIHILDLQKTLRRLDDAYNFVRDVAQGGGTVLFVGTKRQAQPTIQAQAERCRMPYVNIRWLGGTLTNFRTIRERVDKMIELEKLRDEGHLQRLPKKEALKTEALIQRLQRRLGGLRDMSDLPDVVFVVDVGREYLAVKEANRLNIPIIAMVDSNCDPTPIDYVIPANDDAIRAIKLITSKITDAVIEGKHLREITLAEEIGGEEEEALEGEIGAFGETVYEAAIEAETPEALAEIVPIAGEELAEEVPEEETSEIKSVEEAANGETSAIEQAITEN